MTAAPEQPVQAELESEKEEQEDDAEIGDESSSPPKAR